MGIKQPTFSSSVIFSTICFAFLVASAHFPSSPVIFATLTVSAHFPGNNTTTSATITTTIINNNTNKGRVHSREGYTAGDCP